MPSEFQSFEGRRFAFQEVNADFVRMTGRAALGGGVRCWFLLASSRVRPPSSPASMDRVLAAAKDCVPTKGWSQRRRCRPLLQGLAWGRVRRGLAASGGQTRETSAWKLEERRALGLTRVSMDTCVLHETPLLPPHGCWDLELQPRTPCRCQRRHFRRSSACT